MPQAIPAALPGDAAALAAAVWALLWLAGTPLAVDGSSAQDRGSLGTLSRQRVAKIAGLAGAVAALAAMSFAAGHMARVAGPPAQAHSTSVVSPQPAPVFAP